MIGAVRRTALALPLAVALVASACSDGPPPDDTAGRDGGSGNSDVGVNTGGSGDPGAGVDPGVEPAPVVIDVSDDEIILTARLVRFDDCDALLDQLRNWAADRVGPWGLGRDPHAVAETAAMRAAEAEAIAEAALAAAQSAEPATDFERQPPVEGVDYSGTNVQEAGVDEADIIKTDGRRIFAMSAGQLVVVDAARREVLGSVLLPIGESAEMFLDGDSLLAIQQTGGRGGEPLEAVVHRIDVRDGVPEVVETIRVEGSYVSARSIGGVSRVILRSQPVDDFPFVYPSGPDSEATAEEANRASMLASTLEDWLPAYSQTSQNGATTEGLLPPCEQMHTPTVFSGFGVTTVLSVPMAGAIDPAAATSVLAPGETVYASLQSMYVSTTTWIDPSSDEAGDIDWDQFRAEFRTNIHRFDISDPARGRLHRFGQRARRDPQPVRSVGARRAPARRHHIRRPSKRPARELGEGVGRVRRPAWWEGRLGRRHRTRRAGCSRCASPATVGYVVTFRQIDPFYTIDLSDPTEPAVVGELKIPGFSSYLHPIGDALGARGGIRCRRERAGHRGQGVAVRRVRPRRPPGGSSVDGTERLERDRLGPSGLPVVGTGAAGRDPGDRRLRMVGRSGAANRRQGPDGDRPDCPPGAGARGGPHAGG